MWRGVQARMKYLVHEWGVPKFRSVVEQYFGKKFQPFRCARSLCQPLRLQRAGELGVLLGTCPDWRERLKHFHTQTGQVPQS